jgi:hypothetical protein
MSRATEIAEREAAEAEAEEVENPDAEPVEPIEPDEEEAAEEEAKPDEPSSLATVQAIDKALEAEQKRHRNALAKALGEQFEDFDQCPLCQVDGYAMQYQPGEVSPEQREAILTVMGDAVVLPILHDPNFKRCDACNGHGKRETGSLMEAYFYETCSTCQTTGRVAVNGAQPAAQTATVTTIYPWDEAATPAPTVNTDRWGRPQSHPDFGLDPVSIVSTHVAG